MIRETFAGAFPRARSAPAGGWGAPLAAALALGLAVFLLYLPAGRYPFFFLDDSVFTGDPLVRDGGAGAIARMLVEPSVHFGYLPLTRLSFLADAALFGGSPGASHLVNVVLFSACAALLPLLLWRLTGCPWKSFFAAALVAFHPMRVEPVAWISARKDLLYFLFLILCLASYLRYARTGRPGWYAATALLALWAMLAKPVAVIVPALLLLADAWPLERLRCHEDCVHPGAVTVRRLLFLAGEKVPLVIPAALVALHVTSFTRETGSLREGISFASRTGHALVAPMVYLRQSFWPVELPFRYFRTPWDLYEGSIPWALAGLVAGTIAIVLLSRKRPYLGFGWGWYLVALLPTAAVVPASVQWLSDRFTLVPHVGLAVAVVWLADGEPAARLGKLLSCAAAAALLALALLSGRQLSLWRGSVPLLEAGLPHNGNDPAYIGDLVSELTHDGKLDRAGDLVERILPRALDAETDGSVQLRHLEYLERAEGRPRAIEEARRYLSRSRDFPLTRLRLADLLFLEGRFEESREAYRDAMALGEVRSFLSRSPAFSPTRLRMADLLLDEGRHQEAEEGYRRILDREILSGPDRAHALEGWGLSLAARGRSEEARARFEEGLRSFPESPTLRDNLGRLSASGGGRNPR